MELSKAVIYGIIQGLTEFLPVSSNAHIRIFPALVHWPDPGAAFTAVIQLGTVLAVLIYFAKDLKNAFMGWANSLKTKDRESQDARVGWAVLYGTIPIVVLGLLLHTKIETTFRSLYVIAASMIGMAIVMIVAERIGKRNRDLASVEPKDGIRMGLWQCLALVPGMSRSGSTISGALFDGFTHAEAARFSFLMGVPSIAAAGFYEAFKERHSFGHDLLVPTLVASIVAFVVGYAVIAWFIKYLGKKGIGPFIIYRIVLGIVLIVLLRAGTISPDAGADVPEKESAVALR